MWKVYVEYDDSDTPVFMGQYATEWSAVLKRNEIWENGDDLLDEDRIANCWVEYVSP